MITDLKMMPSRRGRRVLVAGLGNLLLQDDGVGVHAVHELGKHPRPGVLAVEIGTSVLNALHLLEWADMVLAIDAVEAGGAPGSIYLFDGDGVSDPSKKFSLHELSLRGALNMIAPDRRPPIAVLGVEPAVIHYGMELTPTLQAALPSVVHAALKVVDEWCHAVA